MNLAVLASTNGTDLQAIIDEIKAGSLPNVELKIVISNKADSYALIRAQEQGFKTKFLDPKIYDRENYDREIVQILQQEEVELVALIGYFRILTPEFVKAFRNRIINVHPSLIPKFSGKGFYGNNVHQAVLEAGDTESGCTIHFVDEGCDTGKIIVQGRVAVEAGDTADILKEKVQNIEKKLYPQVIRDFANGQITLG